MGFLAEQEAIGGKGVDADEHRQLDLEDFIEQCSLDGIEHLPLIDAAGAGDRVLDEVVDATKGDVPTEAIVKMVDDAAVGTTAIEQQGQDVLSQQPLGDGKVKEDFVVVLCGCGESLVEGLLGDVDLLVNELAADVGLLGHRSDGERAAEGLEGQGLPFFGPHVLGGTTVDDTNVGWVGFGGEGNSVNHVCFPP